jgi:hypothetical protein
MMKSCYDIQAPEIVSWINTGLDTVSYFRSKTFTPQANASHNMTNMVYGDQFLIGDTAFRMVLKDNHLVFEQVDNGPMLDFMHEYKAFDDYVMNNNALLPVDDNKTVLLQSVDEPQSLSYMMNTIDMYPIDTLGEDGVFKLKLQFPFRAFEVPFKESLQNVVVYCDCDIYIPSSEEENNNISFGIAVMHPDRTRETIKITVINQKIYSDFDVHVYPHYDQWAHFSTMQNVSRTSFSYQPGDVLIGYFINLHEQEFYVTNYELKVVGVLE